MATPQSTLGILAVDIGGTFIKASVIDGDGALLAPYLRVATPIDPAPSDIVQSIAGLAKDLPDFDKISVAFPGVVKNGRVLTAPNLGNERWANTNFAGLVETNFGRRVRMLNDAVVQGLGCAVGPGLECVITFGTGLGFSLFRDADFLVQLELGRHNAAGEMNYDQFVGHAAYVAIGVEKWNERAAFTIDAIRKLVNFDRLYVGGGNARRLTFALPPDALIIPVTAGVSGGARLWTEASAELFT